MNQDIYNHDEGAATFSTTSNLFNINSSGSNDTFVGDTSASIPSQNNAFFIFPVMGLLVLILGSLYLRHRRIQQSEQSAEIYAARLRAQHDLIKLKTEQRLVIVGNALVTTKVVTRNNTSPERRTSFAMTESTSDSCNSYEDSTNDDLSEDLEAHSESKDTIDASYISSVMTLEHPIDMDGWKLESCAICLEAYRENDRVSYSKHRNCSHAFHTECILNWLQVEYRNDCPCCRSQYIHVSAVEPNDDPFFNEGPSVFVSATLPEEDQSGVTAREENELIAGTSDEEQAIIEFNTSVEERTQE